MPGVALAAIEFDFRYAIEGLPKILLGLPITILLTLVVMAVSLPFGILLGARVGRTTGSPARRPTCTRAVRTTPILLWVFLLFFALPTQLRINLDPFWIAVLALSLNISAFLGEIFRGR